MQPICADIPSVKEVDEHGKRVFPSSPPCPGEGIGGACQSVNGRVVYLSFGRTKSLLKQAGQCLCFTAAAFRVVCVTLAWGTAASTGWVRS